MSLLRLLSASASAFAAVCAMSAAAQSPVAPTPTPFTSTPTPFSTFHYTLPPSSSFLSPPSWSSSPLTAQQAAPATPFILLKAKPAPAPTPKILTATNDGCFTMRSYGFTAGDLRSAPRLSSSTTCTPAHTVTLKDATVTSTK